MQKHIKLQFLLRRHEKAFSKTYISQSKESYTSPHAETFPEISTYIFSQFSVK